MLLVRLRANACLNSLEPLLDSGQKLLSFASLSQINRCCFCAAFFSAVRVAIYLSIVPTKGPGAGMKVGPASGIDLFLSVVPVPVKLGGGGVSYNESSSSILSNWSVVLCLLLGLSASSSKGVSGTSSMIPCALGGFWNVLLVPCPTKETALLVFTMDVAGPYP